jgi:hypothetical protein
VSGHRILSWHIVAPPIVTADRANYATVTHDGRTILATVVQRSNVTSVTPDEPIPLNPGDTLRVTLSRNAAPAWRFAIIPRLTRRARRLRRAAQRQAHLRALQLAQRTPQRGGPLRPRAEPHGAYAVPGTDVTLRFGEGTVRA